MLSCSRSLLLCVVLLWLWPESEATSEREDLVLELGELRYYVDESEWMKVGSGGQRQDFREMKF